MLVDDELAVGSDNPEGWVAVGSVMGSPAGGTTPEVAASAVWYGLSRTLCMYGILENLL